MRDFILPDLGEGIVECEIVEWLIHEGDLVEEDQMIVEVMTDKAVVQIPATDAGKVTKLYYQQGEIARVHEPLFRIVFSSENPATSKKETTPESALADNNLGRLTPNQNSRATEEKEQKKILATPAVRRLGKEQNLDLSQVVGSGKEGRILKEDLESKKPSQPPSSEMFPADFKEKEEHVEPLRGIQLAMSDKMTESAATIPHLTYGEEIDLTDLVDFRNRLKPQLKDKGINLTLMPFFMKALSLAIQQYPLINSRLKEQTSEIVYQQHCNIGMAVDTPMGLLVPNVKGVQDLSIIKIAQELQRLIQAAKEKKLAHQDMQQGTVTISNIGAIGGTFAVPIINKPEVAIVALGGIQKLPRYNIENELEPRKIMQISWSCDHRIIDGGTIARFCNFWKQLLEEPASMLFA